MQSTPTSVLHDAAALPEAGNLANHCLTCRRRRVKCDTTQPTCLRCKEDNISCRGYKQRLKFIPFNPPSSSKPTTRRITSRLSTKEECSETNSPSIYKLSQDKDELAIIDAIRCYNKYVTRYISPAHHPFERQEIPEGVDWQLMPSVLRNILIITTRSSQAVRNNIDPTSRQDIRHYRGLSLHALKHQLPDAVADPYGLILGCILLFMAVDMHPSAEGSWIWHLQAARQIIELRCGLHTCLCDIPNLKVPLLNYMIIEILTATTCKSKLIFANETSMRSHSDIFGVLPLWEEYILASSYPCPCIILQTIVRTNLLRSFDQPRQALHISPGNFNQEGYIEEFSSIFDAIHLFDVPAWSARVLQKQLPLPQQAKDCPSSSDMSAFTSLGVCYKSAALLYLILSSKLSYDENLHEVIQSTKQSLDEHSSLLFKVSDRRNEDGPLCTQLWKFLTWPLMISAYTCVGWNLGLGIGCVEAELDRFKINATTFGLTRLVVAIEYMQKLWRRRKSAPQIPWHWDDGFLSRASFAL